MFEAQIFKAWKRGEKEKVEVIITSADQLKIINKSKTKKLTLNISVSFGFTLCVALSAINRSIRIRFERHLCLFATVWAFCFIHCLRPSTIATFSTETPLLTLGTFSFHYDFPLCDFPLKSIQRELSNNSKRASFEYLICLGISMN